MKYDVWGCFIMSLGGFLGIGSMFCKPCFFIPYLIIASYRYSLYKLFFLGLFCGLLVDFFSSFVFGFHVLNYGLTTLICYKLKNHLFEEKFLSLPLATLVFSMVFSLISNVLLLLFGINFIFSIKKFLQEIYYSSLIDLCFATIVFTLPIFLGNKALRLWILFKRKKF